MTVQPIRYFFKIHAVSKNYGSSSWEKHLRSIRYLSGSPHHNVPAWRSLPLDELFTAIHTVGVPFTSAFRMFFLTTHFSGNLVIHHLAAHWTKAHRCIWTPVVEVGTTAFSRHHLYSPSPLFLPFISLRGQHHPVYTLHGHKLRSFNQSELQRKLKLRRE